MAKIDIDREVFKCAANRLNLHEIQSILSEHGVIVNRKDKKHELVNKVLNLIDENRMSEKLYIAIKTKAFSDDFNFHEGFFYQYSIENIDFTYQKFEDLLEQESKKDSTSKYSNSTFTYNYNNLLHNEAEGIVKFSLLKETKKGKYDCVDDDVKFFNEKINACVDINYREGLVYIHCKNANNSTAIKFFIEKIINSLRVDVKKGKTKLSTPRFDNNRVSKWASDNKIDIKGISTMSIQMIDLLFEFQNEDNQFSAFCMNKIYFGNEVINTESKNLETKSTIKGSIFYGDDIQECKEIAEGIINGKKINGFELSVDFIYEDECTGSDPILIKLPIAILQDNNKSIRTAILQEIPHITDKTLFYLYEDIKNVFKNKLNSSEIKNTEEVVQFINRSREILSEEGEMATSQEEQALVL